MVKVGFPNAQFTIVLLPQNDMSYNTPQLCQHPQQGSTMHILRETAVLTPSSRLRYALSEVGYLFKLHWSDKAPFHYLYETVDQSLPMNMPLRNLNNALHNSNILDCLFFFW